MTLNRRTGSGSDLAGSQYSTANHLAWAMKNELPKALEKWLVSLSVANRPGRYRFLFCG